MIWTHECPIDQPIDDELILLVVHYGSLYVLCCMDMGTPTSVL